MMPEITDWPPLLDVKRLSIWVRLRDIVLTSLVWAWFLWLFRGAVLRAADWLLVHPIGELTHFDPPDWMFKWQLLQPFVQIAALMALWLMLWAFLRRRQLGVKLKIKPPPATLHVSIQAQRCGIDKTQLIQWRAQKILWVDFDETGTLCFIDLKNRLQHVMQEAQTVTTGGIGVSMESATARSISTDFAE